MLRNMEILSGDNGEKTVHDPSVTPTENDVAAIMERIERIEKTLAEIASDGKTEETAKEKTEETAKEKTEETAKDESEEKE